MVLFLKRVARLVPGLYVVDVDVPLDALCKDDDKLEQVALGRKFHISLGRTVPIRAHQIDSLVTMLRQKLQFQGRYWIDFNKWEVFVNDDGTRTFLSMEVTAKGLAEVTKQIQAVNEVYKLHNLPEFYECQQPAAISHRNKTLRSQVRPLGRLQQFYNLVQFGFSHDIGTDNLYRTSSLCHGDQYAA
ncbi:hypothetical protein L484_017081 [Morus notabilis]|uniref:U6 snRNA phosphodiesterase 1 n=1 Tax=Morus notabilis TaxID=981085 RepID=W9SQQ7_9ROSA|nr:hypothetical protein L484_017081 [Morus notabilis]